MFCKKTRRIGRVWHLPWPKASRIQQFLGCIPPVAPVVGFEPTTNRLIPTSSGLYPLNYSLRFSRRSRINRADFQALISRSRRIALERSGHGSDQTRIQGPFLRVNLPEILSVRL